MCKCENVQMLGKCANVRMCKCVNGRLYLLRFGLCSDYQYIKSFAHFPHLHIIPFGELILLAKRRCGRGSRESRR